VTDEEIRWRLRRVYAALGDASGIPTEEAAHSVTVRHEQGFETHVDFSGGRSAEQLETDANSILNEIMGIKDRARAWMKGNGKDPNLVEDFIKSSQSAALVHDLANADKHGQPGSSGMSGQKPVLRNISRSAMLKRDPITGLYPPSGTLMMRLDSVTGKVEQLPGENTEVGITGDIVDAKGAEISKLHDVIFEAIRGWENFLTSQGLKLR